MAYITFTNGSPADADEVNNNFNLTLEIMGRQMDVALQGYLSGARSSVLNTTEDENTLIRTFSAESDVSLNAGFTYSGANDYFTTNLQEVTGSDYHVIISADSLVTGSFTINNCTINEITLNKWAVQSTSGDYEVQRAEVIKTLFYGTDGSDPAAATIVNATSMETSDPRDINKQGHLADMYTQTDTSNDNSTYTGTFIETGSNLNCSSWSYLSTGADQDLFWKMSDTLNSTDSGTSDETGTDTSADEKDNPATCQLKIDSGGTGTRNNYARAIVLATGSISWAAVHAGTPLIAQETQINFLEDYGIPVFEASSITKPTLITSVKTISNTFNYGCGTALTDIDSDDTKTVSISFDNGATYTETDKAFETISATGSNMRVKVELELNDTDTKTVYGIGGYANLF